MTTVVHVRDPYDVYIGRPSKWGNPFVMSGESTRDAVIKKYRAWLMQQPELLAALPELRGKILGCWCSPKACHGDVLSDLVNGTLVKITKAKNENTKKSVARRRVTAILIQIHRASS